jgi:hypothetical protein
MRADGPTASPLCLIVGLPGSGKTVYLSMLGAMLGLRQKRFCFPYEGVEPNWVKVDRLVARHRGGADPDRTSRVSARIRDLVFDFGMEQYESYLSLGHWPPATVHEEGDDARPATYFLVSEIQRRLKPLARIVTLETSGEHYREVLRNFPRYAQGAPPANPTQRVLLDLINTAEGFVLLLDPDNADTDAIFKNFFMVLKDGLRPRALNALYRGLREQVDGTAPGAGDVRRLVQAIREDENRRRAFEERFAAEKRVLSDRLAQVARRLETGAEDLLAGEDGRWLESMERELSELEPALVRSARERLLPEGAPLTTAQVKERVCLYFKGLVRICSERADFLVRGSLERARTPQDRSAVQELVRRHELSENFKVEVDEASFQEREVTHFKRLRHLAVVVTKSDKYPIVYPPDQYARRKLPACDMHLNDIQDYLRLCGGQVRFYNASASGYSILSGGAHVPGPAATQTPINVLEPLFDMLSLGVA